MNKTILKPSSHKWVYPSLVWLSQILLICVISYISPHLIPPGPYPLHSLWSWDSGWYLDIARYGYKNNPQATAFFPLYPLLISMLHNLTGLSVKLSSLIIANGSLLAALLVLFRLITDDHSERIAQRSVWLLISFPAAIFFHCAYTESTNLLFYVLFFYCLRRDWWYRAMLCGFFSTVIHDTGLLLVLPGLAYLWMNRHTLARHTIILRFISLALIPASLIAYMIYLYIQFGDPLIFIHAHTLWNNKITVPIIQITLAMGYLLIHPFHAGWNFWWVSLLQGGLTLLIIYMGFLMLTRYRQLFSLPIKVFFVATVLVTLSFTPSYHLDSFSRYMVVLFPAFVVWAYLYKRSCWLMLSISLMLLLKIGFLVLFANGYWLT